MLNELINKSKAHYCVECRKCSSICPVTRICGDFSPTNLVERCIIDVDNEILNDSDIWKCLSCGLCNKICPSGVDFLSFIQELRFLARKTGNVKVVPHNEIFEKIKTFIDNQDTVIPPIRHGETDENADMLYFAGCLPFLDSLFRDIGFSGIRIIEDTVSLLNTFDIIPDIMYGCCGHDAFWSGDNELFGCLKNKNIEIIMKKKPKTIIFSCPECYRTLKLIYPDMNAELMHISEFLSSKNIITKKSKQDCTFHDSCRLGKHMNIYDQPRESLAKVGVNIKEMEHNRDMSSCCDTFDWLGCHLKSEKIRNDRLAEAKKVADVLITTCPKCQIHFKCTLSHKPIDIQVKDFVEVIAERLQ